MENYQSVKENLLERRKEIVERLEKVNKHLRHTDKPLENDFAEQAVERENDEVLEALEENMRKELTQIDHALSLIEKGEYGICANCSDEISPKRLIALPDATLCINCAA